MRLDDEEQDILAGKFGAVRQQALQHQIAVGTFFGAEDFVPVTQTHIMADTESLGEAGVRWLEGLAAAEDSLRRVRIPTITDPRGTDFAKAAFLGHTPSILDLEQRAIAAFVKLGVTMTNTCINYQTIQAPTRNEHVAFGDTGVVIYSNSVCGARSNFEGGPSALSAGLTGRTPRYGYHLDERRQASLVVDVAWTPRELNDWGALGGLVGRLAGDYWQVPVLTGIDRVPALGEHAETGLGGERLARGDAIGGEQGPARRRVRKGPIHSAGPRAWTATPGKGAYPAYSMMYRPAPLQSVQ